METVLLIALAACALCAVMFWRTTRKLQRELLDTNREYAETLEALRDEFDSISRPLRPATAPTFDPRAPLHVRVQTTAPTLDPMPSPSAKAAQGTAQGAAPLVDHWRAPGADPERIRDTIARMGPPQPIRRHPLDDSPPFGMREDTEPAAVAMVGMAAAAAGLLALSARRDGDTCSTGDTGPSEVDPPPIVSGGGGDFSGGGASGDC